MLRGCWIPNSFSRLFVAIHCCDSWRGVAFAGRAAGGFEAATCSTCTGSLSCKPATQMWEVSWKSHTAAAAARYSHHIAMLQHSF